MQTLYIDVYFLINFVVDILSLFFASVFAKIPTTISRLIMSAFLGAAFACGILFLPEIPLLKLILSGITLVIMALVAAYGVKTRRKVKFSLSFIIFQALVGGGVSLLWGMLDKYLYSYIYSAGGEAVNRKLLLFAVAVLLSIGVFKMFVGVFSSNECERKIKLEIKFLNSILETEALVDTGNLAIDPMDMRPVLFIKPDEARKIFPESVIQLGDPDKLDREVRKRIRLVPISKMGETHVLTGIKPDDVNIINANGKEKILVTVAIDKEGGSYGGYGALVPAAALGDVAD